MKLLAISATALFLLFPFITVLLYASAWRLSLTAETLEVFVFTFTQALASAILSLVLGVAGGLGLLWSARVWGERRARWLEAAALVPNAVPVLLLLLAVIKFFPWARGLEGIVFVHVLLNAGIVAVSFLHLVRTKIAGLAELAWVEGASGAKFFRKGALPLLAPDLAMIGLFVFALCFASFAVPLMLGGSRATTLEVLIYQKIRIYGDWGEAIGLASLQMLAVLALSLALYRGRSVSLEGRPVRTPLLSWPPGLALALAPSLILVAGLVEGTVSGTARVLSNEALMVEMPALLLGSLAVSLMTGFLVGGMLLLIAFANPSGTWRKLLAGYAAPSTVLVGFALLIFWRDLGFATFLKVALGLAMVIVPSFYRLRWDSLLRSLEGQRTVARTLGASDALAFARVVYPQVLRPAFSISALAALWAWGDFAISSVVAERSVTLAMVIQALMGSYRFDAATALVWLMIGGGVATFAFFEGVGRVLGAKPEM